jgi:uncharacterized membrane protein YtjA (UPF0391 family)
MLRYALLFLILALIAGFFGFGGLEGQLAYFAKILVFVFVILFVISLFFGRRTTPVV